MTSRILRIAHDHREAARAFTPNARAYLAGVFLAGLGAGVLVTVFAIYVRASGMSVTVVGDAEGALALAAAVVCLLASPLVAVAGWRLVWVSTALAYAAARLGQAGLPLPAAVLGFSLLAGYGDGMRQAVGAAFLSANSAPRERTHLYMWDMNVRMVSGVIGALAGGWLPRLVSLRATVAFSAVLFLASAVPFSRIRERTRPGRRAFRAHLETVRRFGAWGHTARLAVPQATTAFGAALFVPFVSLYLHRELGASIAQVGLVQGVYPICIAATGLLGPAVGRRFGLVRGTVVTQAASLPLLALIPFATSLPVAAGLIWVRGALMNMGWPLFTRFSMEGVPRREKAIVGSLMALAWMVAWLAGSVVGGRLMAVSYQLPYYVSTVCYVLGTVSTWLLFRRAEHA